MSYVVKNLAPGEEILFQARYHWVRFVPGASVAGLGAVLAAASGLLLPAASGGTESGLRSPLFVVAGVLFLAGVLGMAWRALVDSFDEFAITSFRVIKKSGFVTRTVRQIPLEKVQDVNVLSTHTRPQTGTDGLGGPSATAQPSRASVEERLKEAERLYKTGVLSEAEYQEKRQALIKEL